MKLFVWLTGRLLFFFLVIVAAGSLNFLLPKLAPKNPIREKLLEQSEAGGSLTDISGLVEAYEAKFGLNLPLLDQYINYISSVLQFDLGYSIAYYPTRVSDILRDALPWTIGLLFTTTILSFALGTLLGALLGWERRGKIVAYIAPAFMVLAALPYYLFGLLLVYVFAFLLPIFPLQGGYSLTASPIFEWGFVLDILYHSILPALSIILTSIGSQALAMRGMIVTLRGEDYVVYAEANGLSARRRFFQYGLRNALLPQITALALNLGHVATGAILVERVFGYPGLGMILFQAISQSDYFVIYGVILVIVLMIAISTFIVDLIYPLLDPRIRSAIS